MEMNKDILLIFLSVSGTFLFRYLWDRYFAQSSRVTAKEFKDKMFEVERQLIDGKKTFKQIGSCIQATCLIMLQLCEKSNIDCNEIRKKMIEAGMDL